jgi:hypothetical protein
MFKEIGRQVGKENPSISLLSDCVKKGGFEVPARAFSG